MNVVGVTYPGLYHAAVHAVVVASDVLDWYVDTYRCVAFPIIGAPWTPPTTWHATLLPPCLTMSPTTGQICGAAMRVGVTPVTVTAIDATGRLTSVLYTINVKPKP